MQHFVHLARLLLIATALGIIGFNVVPRLVEGADAPAPSGETGGAPPRHEKTLLDLYREGGWVMHMVALTSVGMLSVLAYCIMKINRKSMIPDAAVQNLRQALERQDVAAALDYCEKHPSSLSHVIRESLNKAGTGVVVYTKADLEAAASETIFHEETRFMTWVNMLNAFAAVAPMIGLLGTVSGMIQSFEKLSSGASKASDFAGGIGEAMVGTAGGLLVAIPAMFAYFYFKNALQMQMSRLATIASHLIGKFITGTSLTHEIVEES